MSRPKDRFWCPRCAIVRDAEEAPYCRHGDPMLVAGRMEPLPAGHPLHPGADTAFNQWLLSEGGC